jgi:small nuclear ribonucleoprotein (snRNP)-like protein
MCLDMRRYERLYEAKKNAKNNNLPLIHSFLNRKVKVKVSEALEVQGVLIRYQLQSVREHKPNLLFLKNGRIQIVRGNWLAISEVKP